MSWSSELSVGAAEKSKYDKKIIVTWINPELEKTKERVRESQSAGEDQRVSSRENRELERK